MVVEVGCESREEEENVAEEKVADGLEEKVADGLEEKVADGLEEKVADDLEEDDLEVRGVRMRMGASSGPTPLETMLGLAGVCSSTTGPTTGPTTVESWASSSLVSK